ncbi:DUF3800 domain-containing protein [Subtercola endophyticus]|uniref:DUF3800 domain-containing protein n=1 Tax=Subtercola endophyticus TaxID=2895559 RepID=UPI001E6242A5|nr:DUF3800 domain-containing protein [Subtercola endophyticus]UFS58375.1 hypothetical protein LQ955_15375 [Subtercola endophyticus]
MLVSYVDESYSDDFYFIAAAIAPRETWERVAKSFVEIRGATARLHGTALDIELHGHELMGGKGEWTILRGRHREAAGVYLAALKICRVEGVKYVFRGVDLVRLRKRYAKPAAPHGIVFGHLLERIDDYAKRLNEDDKVIVIADEIATQAVHQKEFESYTLTGTPGYRVGDA